MTYKKSYFRIYDMISQYKDDPETAWEILCSKTANSQSTNKVSKQQAVEIWRELFFEEKDIWEFKPIERKVLPPEEISYMEKVASLGCIICKEYYNIFSMCEIHHIRETVGYGMKSDNYDIIGLCPIHHRYGTKENEWSIHLTPKEFREKYCDEFELLKLVKSQLGVV